MQVLHVICQALRAIWMCQLPIRILGAAAAVSTVASAVYTVMTVPIVADAITITNFINSLEHMTVLRQLLRVDLLILRVMQ